MKNINLIICLFATLVWLCGCEDFLERVPKTEINEGAFFNNAADLEAYTNSLYAYLPSPSGPDIFSDLGSDNITIFGNYTVGINQVVMGNVSSSTLPGSNNWSNWANLRRINFFLVNAGRATGCEADINHYIGIARFFRALFYFSKVQTYSDVPLYDAPLANEDEGLYKGCDTRAMVMDSVLADIEFAANNIKPALGNRNRINQYAALTAMARICLFEGTYRKYHSEINLQNDAQRFLEKAAWASEQVINSGQFEITGDYGALFDSDNLNSNKEIILQQSTGSALGVGNNSHVVLNEYWGLSRSLMETYLMKDGTPFTQQLNYGTKTYLEVFENRDPRFEYTFCTPGFKQSPQQLTPAIPNILYGGYAQIKFYPKKPEQRFGWNMNYTSMPIYRYAEVLLVYAEAKAELGQLTQADLDKSINKLRDRAGVKLPYLNLASANATPDPVLATYYPEVTGSNKGVILEIRRERRVELACEGFRVDDLKRWGAGARLADNNQGIYIPALGAYDMTGDGEPDVAILENPTATGPIDHLTAGQKAKLVIRYLKKADNSDEGFYLTGTDGKSGHIGFTTFQKVPRNFISPKYYYYPIPRQQIILNPNLKQPFGWE